MNDTHPEDDVGPSPPPPEEQQEEEDNDKEDNEDDDDDDDEEEEYAAIAAHFKNTVPPARPHQQQLAIMPSPHPHPHFASYPLPQMRPPVAAPPPAAAPPLVPPPPRLSQYSFVPAVSHHAPPLYWAIPEIEAHQNVEARSIFMLKI